MTTATQTLELVDELVKAKIPKKTATKLIDYVDNRHNGNIDERLTNIDKRLIKVETSITFLKWITGIGFTVTITIATALPLYLHNDTKDAMREIKTDMQTMEKRNAEQMKAMKADMKAMEKRNIERHNELKRLIQKGK